MHRIIAQSTASSEFCAVESSDLNLSGPSGWLKRYTERMVAGPQNTPEEIAEPKASRKELLGTSNEWAQMPPDRSIPQNFVQLIKHSAMLVFT